MMLNRATENGRSDSAIGMTTEIRTINSDSLKHHEIPPIRVGRAEEAWARLRWEVTLPSECVSVKRLV